MELVLYSRTNCHLCDAFEDELQALLQSMEIVYEKVDIDSEPKLQALYGNDVPVLTLNSQTINQHFFDKDKILKVLT